MSRFEEENSIMKHHMGVLKKYPFVGLGFGAGLAVLFGRIIHFWKFRKSKIGREMYFLETRIYTQGTIVIIVALPVIYDMIVFYYKKICGIPIVKEYKPLPKDLEYIPGKGPKDSSKLKEFADDNFKFDGNGRKFFKWVDNTMGKGEIALYEQFFPDCFQ